jgi:hypothetical protein
MEWVKIYEDTSMQNVAAIRNELEQENIVSNTMNKIDTLYPSLGEIEVYVQPENEEKAKEIISRLKL